jgi:hypothetical protein
MTTENTIIITEDEYTKLMRIKMNMKKAQKKWVAANRAHLNEYKRGCYASSEYQYKQRCDNYYEKNKETIKERSKIKYQQNKEAIKERNRIKYQQKKEAKQQEQKIAEK